MKLSAAIAELEGLMERATPVIVQLMPQIAALFGRG